MPFSRRHAYERAWSLAITLMASIVVFQAGDGSFGVVPESEYDGDDGAVIHTFDPHAV